MWQAVPKHWLQLLNQWKKSQNRGIKSTSAKLMTLTITSRKVIIMKRIDKESIVAAKLLAFGNMYSQSWVYILPHNFLSAQKLIVANKPTLTAWQVVVVARCQQEQAKIPPDLQSLLIISNKLKEMLTTFPQCNFWPVFPEILCENLIHTIIYWVLLQGAAK